MTKTLHRYVLGECVPPLILSVAVFTFFLLLHRLFKLSDLVVAKGVPVGEVLRLLALSLPAFLPLLIPVGLLLATMFAFARMSSDHEVVAMRACGLGLPQNLAPVAVISMVVFLATAVLCLWVQPHAAREFKLALYRHVKNRITLTTETGVFSRMAPGVTLYAESIDDRNGEMRNLFLEMDRAETPGFWILAESGTVQPLEEEIALDLRDGEMHQSQSQESPYRLLKFRKYRVRIPIPGADWTAGAKQKPTRQLVAEAIGPQRDPEARLELHHRLALPVSCLVFGLLGAALGVQHSRESGGQGLLLCLLVLLAYYALLTAGHALGKRHVLPPELASWLPIALLAAGSVFAIRRKLSESPLPLEASIARLLETLRRRFSREVHQR